LIYFIAQVNISPP